MTADRSHEPETDAERARLRALVARLSDADLARPMPGGWTVAAVLAHAAYWDARAIYWIDRWGPDGEPTTYEDEDTDAANEAAKPLCLTIRPRDAAELALRVADEADRKVRALSDTMLAKIAAQGGAPFDLSRANHRREHLDDIEAALRG
ncbi:MAG TPA: DinB family protein [Candidatus Limnocylindria bacterium]|nr:DinB family protein [Candidatus Limnocylindria bacterium]